jgi:hypothetical protein
VRAEENIVFFRRDHVSRVIGRQVEKVAIPMWVGYVYFFVWGVCCSVVALEVLV